MKWITPVAVVLAVLAAGGATAAPRSTCPRDAALGTVAFVRGGSVRVVGLATCRVRVLVRRGARPPVRWSHDGRWIAFGRRRVVPARGGAVLPAVGTEWSPKSDLLAGVTSHGGVLVAGPGEPARRLLPDGWGATGVAFDPSGQRLAVARARPMELWVVAVASGRRSRLARVSSQVELAGWSPGGRWLLFWPYPGASLAADGSALEAVPARGGRPATVVGRMLLYDDYFAWCGTRLVAAAGVDRYSTSNKRLVAAAAPRWRQTAIVHDRSRSWVSPACSPSGRLAAAAGPNRYERRFGQERRALWLLGRPRRQLTRPGRGVTDELPQWSHDARSLLFVRTRAFAGQLYLAKLTGSLVGPIAQLGAAAPYYGHYSWADRLDWYQPRPHA